jgi:glucosamine 6-phosphate synthetase-like amidotransferase/phosphosugar isomerase protein
LLAAEIRGKDATGYVARTESLEGLSESRTLIAKAAVRPSEFVEKNPAWRALRHRRCSVVVGHVRWATHGDPADPRNNHPHVSGHLALVHNGILTAYRDLVDRYCLRTESECDSEVLLRIIERAKTPPIGLALCLLEKPGAIVVYDELRNCLWMGRDESRPLWIGKMKGDKRLWFASTSAILMDGIQEALQRSVAWEFLMPLAPHFVYGATTDGSIGAVYEEPIAAEFGLSTVDKMPLAR